MKTLNEKLTQILKEKGFLRVSVGVLSAYAWNDEKNIWRLLNE